MMILLIPLLFLTACTTDPELSVQEVPYVPYELPEVPPPKKDSYKVDKKSYMKTKQAYMKAWELAYKHCHPFTAVASRDEFADFKTKKQVLAKKTLILEYDCR